MVKPNLTFDQMYKPYLTAMRWLRFKRMVIFILYALPFLILILYTNNIFAHIGGFAGFLLVNTIVSAIYALKKEKLEQSFDQETNGGQGGNI